MNKKDVKRGMLPYLLLIVIALGIYYMLSLGSMKVNDLTYDVFLSEVNKGNVEEVVITPNANEGTYNITGKLKSYNENESFYVKAPLTDTIISQIVSIDGNLNYKLETEADPGSSPLLFILVNVLPIVLIIGVGFWFFF